MTLDKLTPKKAGEMMYALYHAMKDSGIQFIGTVVILDDKKLSACNSSGINGAGSHLMPALSKAIGNLLEDEDTRGIWGAAMSEAMKNDLMRHPDALAAILSKMAGAPAPKPVSAKDVKREGNVIEFPPSTKKH